MTTEREAVNEELTDAAAEAMQNCILHLKAKARECAKLLAQAGSYDHKMKNERILVVISILLSCAEFGDSPEHFDDVPF